MNEGILQSSPAQQMVAVASNNWCTNGNSSLLTPPPSNHSPHHLTPTLSAPLSWPAAQEFPHSWSQLVLGFSGEEDKAEIGNIQHKNMENWEHQLLNNSAITSAAIAGNLEFMAAKSSPPMMSASPPKSCVTTSSMPNEVFSFSDKSSESFMKSNSSNGSSKKPKINQTTSSQSGMKVRKEKLGDRITALHQLVSPFGKTDTASVLLEAIGYIRFLQRQIEALSLPYLGSGSGNASHQEPVKRERSCLFPEDPGQECDKEARKDLKSRGLCLVPISCTLDFGSENNGADYWTPATFGGNFQ